MLFLAFVNYVHTYIYCGFEKGNLLLFKLLEIIAKSVKGINVLI